MDHIFDPRTKLQTDVRWKGFFAQRPLVERIFGYWTSSQYPTTSRNFVDGWATQHVAKKVSRLYARKRRMRSQFSTRFQQPLANLPK
ncbi:hypothetical protein C8R43DRAFT_997287 [Mycena crocata]|nr:hypothetical protein C8R43DRAFT_997287 [Mycena crocata]